MVSSFLFLMMFLSLCFTFAYSQNNLLAPPPCLKDLLPCKGFMGGTTPPSECCDSMQKLMKNDMDCLCKVFNNAEILSLAGLKITPQEALKLPSLCDKDADVSMCSKEEASSPAPGSSSDTNKTTTSGSGSAVNKMPHFGGLGLVAVVMAIIMSAIVL